MYRPTLAKALLQTCLLTTILGPIACGGGGSGAPRIDEDASGFGGGSSTSGGAGGDEGGLNLFGNGGANSDCVGTDCPDDIGPYCGNGVVDPELSEVCDDANARGGDGCSGACNRVEPNFECLVAGQPCRLTVVCGNGAKEAGEGCDDLNTTPGDGCSTVCSLEAGFVCPQPGQPCEPLRDCGNSRISLGEGCDDGNLTDGDGCSAICSVEDGYRCRFDGTASRCEQVPICGDGLKAANEECDDGNILDGDCCSKSCRVEGNYCDCPDAGGMCTDVSRCGNGVLEKVELCDDGNNDSGDGCDAACNVEAGYQCRMANALCVPLCGDGMKVGAEQCDDSNPTDGDGCSSVCRIEPGYDCATGECIASTCGDGTVETGESCDAGDRNGLFLGDGIGAVHGTGCSKTCTWEPSCRDAAGATTRCSAVCGDSNLEVGLEGCDDGNLVDGDGCSALCTVEDGFGCEPQPQSDVEACSTGTGSCLILPITLRDFDGSYVSGTGHPDFFFLGDGNTVCVPNASGVPTERINVDTPDPAGCWSSDATPLCSGLVSAALGANGKPVTSPTSDLSCACRFTDWDESGLVASGDPGAEQCWSGGAAPFFVETDVQVIESEASFAQWYTDNPTVSTTVVRQLELANVAGTNQYTFTSSGGDTVYDDIHEAFEDGSGELDSGFFELDDQTGVGSEKLCNLWPYWVLPGNAACQTGGVIDTQWDPQASQPVGDITGVEHNFYFTTEVRYLFKFEGDEELSFFGDDDVWVFINGILVLDLGAPHERLRGTVVLDTAGATADYEIQAIDVATGTDIDVDAGSVSGLGLEVGGTYEISVFHADRHPRESNYELTLSGFSTQISYCTPECGDGVQAGTEECDRGNENADDVYNGCTTQCRFGPFCGDGIKNGDEQCDNSRNTTVTAGEPDGCAPGCVLPPSCGDGNISPDEECDDGAANQDGLYTVGAPSCSTLCEFNPYCGDGVFSPEYGEECDDGLNIGGYAFCDVGCKLGPRCGDGVEQTEFGEQCDDGNLIDGDDCTSTCGVPGWCGDGIPQEALGELCDLGVGENGNNGLYGGCNSDCTPAPFCGDGVPQTANGEECDYGPDNDPRGEATYGGCLDNCKLGPHCGDGIPQASELCDDGNDSDNDGCTTACVMRGPT